VDRATLSLTSAQQTFSVSNGYDTGAIDVYLNGVKLADGTDFTATNGTSFVLTEAAASGDIVQYTTYDRLTTNGLVSDSGDTMTGDLTINANLAVTGTIDSPQAAKAWVNFSGTTVAKRSDYNVTSITDNGTGDFSVNFTNGFASSDDYAACVTQSADTGSAAIPVVTQQGITTSSTGSFFRFRVAQATSFVSRMDPVNVFVIVFGND